MSEVKTQVDSDCKDHKTTEKSEKSEHGQHMSKETFLEYVIEKHGLTEAQANDIFNTANEKKSGKGSKHLSDEEFENAYKKMQRDRENTPA